MSAARMAARVAGLVGALALGACADDATTGPGGSTAGGACRLVGDPLALPLARNFDVAATADGFELVLGEADGSASYALTDAGLGPRRALPLPSSGNLRLAASPSELFATSVFNATFDGLPIAGASPGGEWAVARDVPSAQGATFTYGSALAVSPSGEVVVVWLGASGLDAKLLWASYGASGFEAFGAVETGLPGLGNDVAAAFDAAGHLLVAFTGADAAGKPGLYAVARPSAGAAWTAATRLGAAEGGAQGIVLSALAIGSGGAYAVVAEPADFMSGADGGVRAYAVDPATALAIGAARVGPRDDRPVVEGVSAAALADGRVVVTASWGENNLDGAQSDDELLLYACGAACREALVVDGARGTFFGPARVATRGQDGVVVYEAEPKLDAGPERTVLRRFTCDVPTE